MSKPTIILLAVLATAVPSSLGSGDFVVELKHNSQNRFTLKKINPKEVHAIRRPQGTVYTIRIWEDLPRSGVRNYYQQALESMPLVHQDGERQLYKLLHKEYNSRYIGFTCLLEKDYHFEYMMDLEDSMGIHISTKATEVDYLARLHDVLFLINNVAVKNEDSSP